MPVVARPTDRDLIEETARLLAFRSPEQLITYIVQGFRFSNEREVIHQNIARFQEEGRLTDYVRAYCVGVNTRQRVA